MFQEDEDIHMTKDRKMQILTTPYPTLNITEKTIRDIKANPKFFTGHVLTSMGKIYTNAQWEKRSNSVLTRPLP